MTTQLPSFVARGERARLFPVLADTSKEGRTLSILLACLESVGDFGRAVLAETGNRFGSRARIETYTEVVLQKCGDKKCRPDGLIVVRSGSNVWTALLEAKVGNSDLTPEQIEDYLELAKLNGIDALITLSNQFAAIPSHHPVPVSAVARRRAALFHWSWMYLLTEASVLLGNEQIEDREQRTILHELVRFLSHPSAGVRSFDQMPAAWSTLVDTVQAGGSISATAAETREVIGAWQQQIRDLSLELSRRLNADVRARLSRAHASDPHLQQREESSALARDKHLTFTLQVPGAAAPIEVTADVQKRTVSVSMWMRAPQDKVSTKARLNWLLRQLQDSDPAGVHVRLLWPGRASATQYPLGALRENPGLASDGREDLAASSFEILVVKDLGAKLSQRRNFVSEIKSIVPMFYDAVGQRLTPWQAPAPRIPEEKVATEAVSMEAIQAEAESVALARDE